MRLILSHSEAVSIIADRHSVSPHDISIDMEFAPATPEGRAESLVNKLDALAARLAEVPVMSSTVLSTAQRDLVNLIIKEVAQGVARQVYAQTGPASEHNPYLYPSKIAAIKAWRTLTGAGLKEAKDVVEGFGFNLERENPPAPEPAPAA